MPRSGSELMQVVLDQHPAIYGSATSPVFGFCNKVREQMVAPEVKSQPAALMKKAVLASCKGLMAGYYEALTDKPTACDKSRGWVGNYQWLEAILEEEPKVICCVRDLREVVASQERTFRANKHLPDVEAGTTTLEQRVESWLTQSHIGAALRNLWDSDRQGVLSKLHIVKYEEFTARPGEIMEGVYEFLGIESFDHRFDDVVKSVEERHDLHGPYGNHEVRRKIEPQPLRAFEVLGRQVCENIVDSNPWFYSTFYK
jgi:hypothetical protein